MLTRLAIPSILTVALLAAPGPARAQVPATLVLASGDTVRGQLVDLNGSGFVMLVGGSERAIPRNDVAVIDFVGGGSGIPASETSKIQTGRNLIVMRGGDFWYGRLFDLGQRDPLLITVQTQDGDREVRSNEVGRIYLRTWQGMPTGDTAQPAPPPAQGGNNTFRTFTIGHDRWVNTGMYVQQGQTLRFTVTGQIQLSNDPQNIARPAGEVNGRAGGRGAPMPAQPQGAFIARVGNDGRPFGIGDQTQPIPMPNTGILFLDVNDASLGDNRGEFTVQISLR